MSIESTIHRLLAEHGHYSPIDLLRAENRLPEELYRAWRTGRVSSLDQAFEDRRNIRPFLESASSVAQALNLESERATFFGVADFANRALLASADPSLNELLCCRYSPPDADQPDLFMDGGKTASRNALLDALFAGDPERARNELSRLCTLVPDYRFQTHADKLISALERPAPQGLSHGLKWLERMESEWRPAAREFLRPSRAQKLLEPLWLGIGHALEPAEFDPQNPERHASHAFEQAGDWKLLKNSVLAFPGFVEHPVLLARLARAESHLGNRTGALGYWFAMCLNAPIVFTGLVESSRFEDPAVARAWQRAMAEGDDEEELSAEWFPAWMLIHEPGLARVLADMNGDSRPERAFNLMRALQRTERDATGRTSRENVSLRRELQRIHAGLLGSYLARRARES